MPNRDLQFVTLSGVPISVTDLRWPFHSSTSGSDWLVLHGRVDLLDSAEKLHAEVAVGMTQTMKDALGSVAEEHAEGLVVNSIRKTVDNGQLAFLKSGKLQPVHITSRYYSFITRKIQFPTQSDDALSTGIAVLIRWQQAALRVRRHDDSGNRDRPGNGSPLLHEQAEIAEKSFTRRHGGTETNGGGCRLAALRAASVV